MILTSNRKFGVEIEFIAPTERIYRQLSDNLPIVSDGSLRPLINAGEYVSPILQGLKGERKLEMACDMLKKHGANSSHEKTSVHIHLDGKKPEAVLRSVSSFPSEELVNDRYVVAISNRLRKDLSDTQIRDSLQGKPIDFFIPYATRFDNVFFYSSIELTRKPKLNYTFYYLDDGTRFAWLKNVLYFYTKFSNVMCDIVSNSRKERNMYCIPLAHSFDLEDIEKTKDESELKLLWYKGQRQGGHFDDSRYHNVNLHAFWEEKGTVEIRSHGGTIEASKILLWVKLHQKIVDKLENITFDELKLIDNTHKAFVEFTEEEILKDYVKRLLGFYSGIIIK